MAIRALDEQEHDEGDCGDEVADGLVGGLGVDDGYVCGAGGDGDGDEAVFAREACGDGGSVVGDLPGGVVAQVEDEGLRGGGVEGQVAWGWAGVGGFGSWGFGV